MIRPKTFPLGKGEIINCFGRQWSVKDNKRREYKAEIPKQGWKMTNIAQSHPRGPPSAILDIFPEHRHNSSSSPTINQDLHFLLINQVDVWLMFLSEEINAIDLLLATRGVRYNPIEISFESFEA